MRNVVIGAIALLGVLACSRPYAYNEGASKTAVNVSCREVGDCVALAADACPTGFNATRVGWETGTAKRPWSTPERWAVECRGPAKRLCGADGAKGCQGSSRWVPSTLACEPC